MSKKSVKDYIALALDNVDSLDALKALVADTSEHIGVYKFGLEQFTRFGPSVLDVARLAGGKIFLDLKFHDIPNTVAKAVGAACALGADYLTVHLQGGAEMVRAAAEAAAKAAHRPAILGVTLLTSIGQETLSGELGIGAKTEEYVRRLAQLAVSAGAGGIVCSAADLEAVRPSLPQGFEVVTPGIRPAGSGAFDQKRVATPTLAIEGGATLLVIGRPITGAQSPKRAAAEIAGEIEKWLTC
jgi:orotidine-5'-phosphate decarboxylase